jgi:hypothetical protein
MTDRDQQSVTDETGLTLADAMKAIERQRLAFEEQLASQKAIIVGQQARLEKMDMARIAIASGNVPIVRVHCNACGDDVGPDGKCVRHPGERVNHIGEDLAGRQFMVKQV